VISTAPAAVDSVFGLELRADLHIVRRASGGNAVLVKDPLRRKYFRYQLEELWLLEQVGQSESLHALQQRFEKKFPPQKISVRQINHLLAAAHRGGLLIARRTGQGGVLIERRRERERMRFWLSLVDMVYTRFRGFDPDRLLARLNGRVGWCLSVPMLVLGACVGLVASVLVATHWTEFLARLPASTSFFGPTNWLALTTTLVVLKVLHEFGHGLACKRLGAECHEMGLLLLCGMPCLYCDTTDAWTLPNRWRRAAIAAAGMYVELWLASLATLVWWFSEPGMVHHLALNIMFTGSVSTLLFNANPLMRYDGYFVLCDVCDLPNLASRADRELGDLGMRLLFGRRASSQRERLTWGNVGLLSYAIASRIYRWCLAAAIFWLLYRSTIPYGFKIVGQFMAAVAMVGLFGIPLVRLCQFIVRAWRGNMHRVQSSKVLWRIGAALLIVAGLLCVPLPHYVRCPARLEPQNAAPIFVETPGAIEVLHVAPGDVVAEGDPIVTLHNPDLELAVAHLESQVTDQEIRLAGLRKSALENSAALDEVGQAEQALAALREELERRREQLASLVVRALRSGTVFAAPITPSAVKVDQLARWTGHPLEVRNRHAWLEASQVVCMVGDARQWSALLAVDGQELDFVSPGQRVDVLPAQTPGERRTTTLAALSRRPMETAPTGLSSRTGGELLVTSDAHGNQRPLFTTYEALATFEDPEGRLPLGGSAIARIHTGYECLATRLLRELRRTFHFEL
jgi:putative peptide zinc metalloprotease protein